MSENDKDRIDEESDKGFTVTREDVDEIMIEMEKRIGSPTETVALGAEDMLKVVQWHHGDPMPKFDTSGDEPPEDIKADK